MRTRRTRIVFTGLAFVSASCFPNTLLGQNDTANNQPVPSPAHILRATAAPSSAGANAEVRPVPEKVRAMDDIPVVPSSIMPTGTITYVCDPNIDAAVAGTCNYLNTTLAGLYSTEFTNANARIYIKYGNTGLGSSTTGFLNLVSYATYRAALAATATTSAHDVAALASLPATEPAIFTSGMIEVTSALGQALGLSGMIGTTVGATSCNTPGTGGCYNGVITVATPASLAGSGQGYYYRTGTQASNQYDIYSVIQHETDEILGASSCIDTGSATLSDGCRSTNASAVDLFRYSAPATRVFVSTTPGAYFSYNGGTTNVATYNTLSDGNDYADFITNCQHIQDAVGCLGQSFNITNDGDTELAILDAVGYNLIPTTAAPSISKAFNPLVIPLGGTSLLVFTIVNPNTPALTGVGFTDNLPLGMAVAGVPNLVNTCGGTVSGAVASSTSFTLSGGALASGATCTLQLSVAGTGPGIKSNTTTVVTSVEAGNGNTASATLTTVAPPAISKVFTPAKILPGGIAALGFTVANPNSFAALPGVGFADTLPSGLVVATPNGLTGSCSGGTITATGGSGSVTLSGATLAASALCTFSVNVTAPEGIYANTSGAVFSMYGPGNTASSTLFAATPPTLGKVFGLVSLPVDSATSLTFTLTNPNHVVTLHGLQFSDALPVGLVVATPNGVTGSCGGGAITAVAGSNLITLSSAALAPLTSCAFSVNVFANGAAQGNLTNITSTVTSNEATPGVAATALIFAGDPYQVNYVSNLSAGDSYVNITNTGGSGAGIGSGTTAFVTGAICANVYVFDASEEVVSCCSCTVTPNGLVSLSAKSDLVSNALTRGVPGSAVIKLVATVPVGGTCNNSAILSGSPTLALGMASWGTTLHANTSAGGAYALTETGFTSSSLSAGELTRLQYTCGAIANVGGGFGVCASCRVGSLGAGRQ